MEGPARRRPGPTRALAAWPKATMRRRAATGCREPSQITYEAPPPRGRAFAGPDTSDYVTYEPL